MALTMQPDEWRSTITARGEQFVVMTGILTMLLSSVDSLVFVVPYMHIKEVVMVGSQDKFCWTVFTVLALSHHYFRADMMKWVTVITLKTLAYNVQKLKVRNKEGSKCI